MKKFRTIFLAATLLILGCGVKGSPKPPKELESVKVLNLNSKQQGDLIVFYWNLSKEINPENIDIFINGELKNKISLYKDKNFYWIDYSYKKPNKEYCLQFKIKLKEKYVTSPIKCIKPQKFKKIDDKLSLNLKNDGIFIIWQNKYPKTNLYKGNSYLNIKPIPYRSVKGKKSFLDKNVRLNEPYCYYITATIDNVESNRVYSECIIFKDLYPPKPPKNLTYYIEKNKLIIIWDYPADKDVKGFLIYKNDKPYFNFLINSYYFIDKNWKEGDTYQIYSVDKAGNKSKPAYLKVE